MEFPDLHHELDDYIKESISHSLGLPVSTQSLQLKLQASEESRRNLQNQYFYMHSRLKERDLALSQARNEASMNAQALKKFVDENQRLADECLRLLDETSRLENECSLYEHDRDALMEFANEVEERAKLAEMRVLEVGEQLGKVTKELDKYKAECEKHRGNEASLNGELQSLKYRISTIENLRLQGCSDNQLDCSECSSLKTEEIERCSHVLHTTPEDSSPVGSNTLEEHLLHSLVESVFDKDVGAENARAFLEENIEVESCQRLITLWDSLTPTSQNIVSLVAAVKALQNDKEHLRINLARAEEEVKVLFEENTVIDEEKNKLLKLYSREKNHHGSGGKHTSSSSSKSNKRKSSPRVSGSIVVGMMDLDSCDISRPPLSPLQYNSPESRVHKK